MTGKYISYHLFNWSIAKNRFVKSILKADGNIEKEVKINGKYLVKVLNPASNMKLHKNWYKSNTAFFKQSFQTF